MTSKGWAAALACGGVLFAAAAPLARATAIDTAVTRPNDAGDTRLYVPAYASFIAESDEAVLTLSRGTGDCTGSGGACTLDSQCPSGVCRTGACRYPESVQVGFVAVVRLSEFCDIAACGPNPLPPECTNGTCGGNSCAVPTSPPNGLCLCSACDEIDPLLAPAEAPFVETFADGVDPRWVLEHSAFVTTGGRSYVKFLKPEFPVAGQPATTPQIGLAQIRVHALTSGETYMVVVKWTFAPFPAPTACTTYTRLSIDVRPMASVCAP